MNLPIRVNEREKRFLVIGGIVALLIVAFNFFSWYVDTKNMVMAYAESRLAMLQRQINNISEKEDVQNMLKAVQLELERQEKMLLPGNTPPVAAAALQSFLKDTATSLGIDVKLERTLNLSDDKIYLGIPVEIGFTTSTVKLKELLVKLRRSPFLLTTSEIKIRVTNISKPDEIFTTLVITGFIKKAPEKETSGKETKNAT